MVLDITPLPRLHHARNIWSPDPDMCPTGTHSPRDERSAQQQHIITASRHHWWHSSKSSTYITRIFNSLHVPLQKKTSHVFKNYSRRSMRDFNFGIWWTSDPGIFFFVKTVGTMGFVFTMGFIKGQCMFRNIDIFYFVIKISSILHYLMTHTLSCCWWNK